MKRSLSDSPTPPPSTPKKTKAKNSAAQPATPTTTGSTWTNERKAVLARICIETAYKNMDWDKLAAETGMTEAQCKNQLTPGRNNLRKTVLDLFGK
ncbi:hypothetical protein I317_03684 [Kwoniella heveanensis CBS 569]|nr:hypothetical protein I317_03684 [Kwoniella heveanensis CBS 569]